MTEKKEAPVYTGYGYHGGGRKPTGRKYKTFSFSCSPEEYEQIRKDIADSGMKASAYFVSKLISK